MDRDPTKCRGTNRAGQPCGRYPIKGGTVCKIHGGGAKQVKAKAEERITEQNVRKQMTNLGVIEDGVDPAETLLWLCQTKKAEVVWLRLQVEETTRDDLVWGKTQHEEGVGPEGPIDKSTSKAEPNIWWRLLREAEDQLAKYSALALKAGVQQRQLELQEAHALILAEAVRRILDQLELSQEQAQRVPQIVPQVLRTLPIGDSK